MIVTWKDRWGPTKGRVGKVKKSSFYVIYDPEERTVFSSDTFTVLSFKAWGHDDNSTFNTSREAWLMVRDIILHHSEDANLPINLEVREVHRRDSFGRGDRINTRDDAATMFLKKANQESGLKGHWMNPRLVQALRWLVTRRDWDRWTHAMFIGGTDIIEEELAEACDQLNVVAVLVEPYVFTENYTQAVALKFKFDGLGQIVDFKDRLA